MRNSNISRKNRAKSKRRAPANYLIVCDAVKNCKYMEKLHGDYPVSKRNPMTKVYEIIEELEEYIRD